MISVPITKTNYIVLQKHTSNDQEYVQAIVYQPYNNSFMTVEDTSQATKFDDFKTANEIKEEQNALSKRFGTTFTYSVIKEEINRTEATE